MYTRVQAVVQDRRTRRISKTLTTQDNDIEVVKGLNDWAL
jgi:hypothetical protein